MLSIESIKLEINVPMKMRDGTILYADVCRPDKPSKYPAILTRLPYNKNVMFPTGSGYMNPHRYARAGYRESGVVIKPIKPGEVYKYSISLGATSNVFKVGHRIRVEISSSNFSKWDRNLNTGHALGQDAEIQLAMQTIYHNRQFPSHIVLPVITK